MLLQCGVTNHLSVAHLLITCIQHLIEVERFVTEGEQLIRQMQGRGVQMQADQLPISAIVRAPLLAIRWQLPSHKVIAND